MPLFARTARHFGSNTAHVVFAEAAHERSRMMAVASSTPRTLRRLIAAGVSGIRLASLNADECHAIADLERLGLRLDRTRRPGFAVLRDTTNLIDQRTPLREVA